MTPLRPAAEVFDIVVRAADTSSRVIGDQVQGVLGRGLVGCWSGTGEGLPGKNLSLKMIALSSGESVVVPSVFFSGGKMVVHLPFRWLASFHTSEASTAL